MPVYEVQGNRDDVRNLIERAVAVEGWPVEARDAALFAFGRPEDRGRGRWSVQVSCDSTSGVASSRVRLVAAEAVVQSEAAPGGEAPAALRVAAREAREEGTPDVAAEVAYAGAVLHDDASAVDKQGFADEVFGSSDGKAA